MIRHTVFFRLKHPSGSAAELDFLHAAQRLAGIPGVWKFERLRQISEKNAFTLGFSMEFADEDAYRGYLEHREHERFVRERWTKEVEDFLEVDCVPFGPLVPTPI
jgi:hypothetical protein